MIALARVGIPLAATVLIKFAVLGVLAFAAARIGTQQAAVHSVAVSLVNLMFTAAVAVEQAAATLTDAFQALFGFGLIGVRRTLPSMLCFAACYGVLALLAVPVTQHGGLTALWGTLAAVNLVLVAAQGWCFRRYSALAAAAPAPA